MQHVNPERLAEGQRHLGVILTAAGVIGTLLENANPVLAGLCCLLGLALMWLGSLEDSQ